MMNPKQLNITSPARDDSEAILSLLKPYVRHCGDETRAAWEVGSRRLLDYLLVYIASGKGQFEIDGVRYGARAGKAATRVAGREFALGRDEPETALR
jgi:hypothetical protein